MNFNSLKVATRLTIAFAAVLAIAVISAVLALSKLAAVEDSLQDIVHDNNVKIRLSNQMAEAVHIVSRTSRTIVLLQDKAAKDAQRATLQKARETYDKDFSALEKMPSDAPARAAHAAIAAARALARPLNDKVLELDAADKEAEAIALLLKEAAPATQKWQDALDQNIALEEATNVQQGKDAETDYSHARNLLLAANLVCIALAAALGWLVTRSITAQLGAEPGDAASLAQSVAAGDLTQPIALGAGDTASLMAQLKTMQDSLTRVVGKVLQGSESVATASAQIAQGTNDLSSRTEEQASALEQTAASMEQLSATVKQNSDSARQANQLAMNASAVAIRGGEVVTQVVDTMKGINESSRRISDIISVIDGIAFQTNILALNAAVEAARAGEQGRGFAVVASEVRSLAGRSAEAAKEIKSLISSSVERVDQGTQLVDQAGVTMSEVVTSIKRVTDLMGEISAASSEQSQGVSQVGEAVMQMDQVTQQNAALVEEMAAAASSLSSQAQDLVQTVSVFKLAQGQGGPGPRSVARMAPRPQSRPAPARALSATAKPKPLSMAKAPTIAAPAAAASGGGDDWESF